MNNYKDHLWVVILAGGGGTRLWPLSRKKNPKQFIKLFGTHTLLQDTARRLSKIVSWNRIWIVTTNPLYGREIVRELSRVDKDHILVEPMARSTAIAHGLAALYIQKIDPEAVILNESADHVVTPVGKYLKTFMLAAEMAFETKSLVAVGIKPAYPHIGMGHIKIGKLQQKINGRSVFKIENFVEKPPLELARKFTESGFYYWNANLYVWRADAILNSLAVHSPKIGHGLSLIGQHIGEENEREVIAKVYKNIPTISIDYAVAEREKNFLMLVADFSWSDVGDWRVVWELSEKDKNGNVSIKIGKKGEWREIDTQNSLVQTERLLITTIGVKDIIIVETKDALLIANKNEVEKVKEMVNILKGEHQEEFL